MAKKRKLMRAGSTPLTPITAKEQAKIRQRIKKRQEQLRKRYSEIHGKVVDFISHDVEDGTLFVSVRFKDKTDFSIRYDCEMFVVGLDLNDSKAGNLEPIRQYMRPIRR